VKAGVPVTDEPVPTPEVATPAPVSAQERRATFAENGLSAGEVVEAPPVPPLLTTTREPW
jgi:hypothetical protein